MSEYDAVVIGSGQGGKPLATALAQSGRKTALIERDQVGGSCINYGCTPTKTMVASARVAYLAGRARDYGVEIPNSRVNLEIVRQRKRRIVQDFRKGSEAGIARTDNLELVRGHARFVSPDRLQVSQEAGGRSIHCQQIFINTGCRPRVPDLAGLADVPYLDSTSIMELARVPEHLVVLGGGYIGLEFGQMFRRFGARVTIVQRASRLLAREDDDVADAVAEVLEEDGIELHLNAEALAVAARKGGGTLLTVGTNNGSLEIPASHLLVATGRTPNSDRLGLQEAGIATDRHGFIQVDDQLRTSTPGVFALGDVKGGPQFTHISYDDYRVLAANLIRGEKRSIEGRIVPYTVFIDPQLGRVGLSEKEARQQGIDHQVVSMPMSHVARALEMDEARGFMKALIGKEDGRILGFAVLGIEGGEVMSQVQMAMMGNLSYTVLRDGIFAHPVLAEALNNLFAKVDS